MSGHSKWSTIKHKKEATDKVKGKLFSKLAKGISVAIKTGGGSSPDTNYKLRMAIEAAKVANMPKVNIDRVLAKSEEAGGLEEVVYEGFGPEGVNIIVEVATDNRNRTAQGIKALFERGGGSLAGPGAVKFNFELKGLLVVTKPGDIEDRMLELIDLGVEDIEETTDGIEVYVEPSQLTAIKEKLANNDFNIKSFELHRKPKNLVSITEEKKAEKVLRLLNSLEDHDDTQKVFANIDIPESIVSKLNN